jgi:hypothetical protein
MTRLRQYAEHRVRNKPTGYYLSHSGLTEAAEFVENHVELDLVMSATSPGPARSIGASLMR